MGIVNAALALLLIFLLIKAPSLGDLWQNRLASLSADYQKRYAEEKEKNAQLERQIKELEEKLAQKVSPAGKSSAATPTFNYTGDGIFKIINEYRRGANVGELSLDPNLCYLASRRLGELLNLGKLDAHQGFIDFDPANKFKYERVGEDLAYGYPSARAVVEAWETSPGHNLVLRDPVNTLGCVAANAGFAVFIAGRER